MRLRDGDVLALETFTHAGCQSVQKFVESLRFHVGAFCSKLCCSMVADPGGDVL